METLLEVRQVLACERTYKCVCGRRRSSFVLSPLWRDIGGERDVDAWRVGSDDLAKSAFMCRIGVCV